MHHHSFLLRVYFHLRKNLKYKCKSIFMQVPNGGDSPRRPLEPLLAGAPAWETFTADSPAALLSWDSLGQRSRSQELSLGAEAAAESTGLAFVLGHSQSESCSGVTHLWFSQEEDLSALSHCCCQSLGLASFLGGSRGSKSCFTSNPEKASGVSPSLFQRSSKYT